MPKSICIEPGCDKPYCARGYCSSHYNRRKKCGLFGSKPCSVEGCPKPSHSRGMCTKHYQEAKRHGRLEPKPKLQCSYPECEKPHHSHGYCGAHIQQIKRGQEPGPLTLKGLPAVDRFWAQVEKAEECWSWTGEVTSSGYAYFKGEGSRYGHRFSYQLHHGPIPDGLHIDHTCFNKTCVNPEHLRAVTHKQNMEHLQGAHKRNATGVRGVHMAGTTSHPFIVHVGHWGVIHKRGPFATLEEADSVARSLRAQLYTHDDAIY